MTLEERAKRMWSIHPKELDKLGLTREEFYLQQLKEVQAEENERWRSGLRKMREGLDKINPLMLIDADVRRTEIGREFQRQMKAKER